MLQPQLGLILLFVEDIKKSESFYENLLGISPVQTSPTFVTFALKNGVMLGLLSRYTAEPGVEAKPGVQEIGFPADNVDAVYESLSKKQIPIAQKPTDMDFGRTFLMLDPDGYRIRVYHLREQLESAMYRNDLKV